MTKDVTDMPPLDTPVPPPPQKPPKRHAWKKLAWGTAAAIVVLTVLFAALLLALTTERGARWAWQAAVTLEGGRLAGTLESGTFATGIRLANFAWTSPGGAGTEVRIDRLSGRWLLTRAPLRLTIATLRAGAIVIHLPPSSSTPAVLPRDLRLPLQLNLADLRVDTLSIHAAGSVTQLTGLMAHGRSNGVQHQLSIDHLETPFGAVSAQARLEGTQPFVLLGAVHYTGKLVDEPVTVDANLSGSLVALAADFAAFGHNLSGHGRLETAPFSAVPLKRATIAVDHLNPRAFMPGAPAADLAVRARLAPVKAGLQAAPAFVVAGPVAIANAKPGTIGEGLLPLLDARAEVRLDARTQRITGLRARLIRAGSVTGGGTLTAGQGRLDLRVANLDLNAFVPAVRSMQLAGPINVTLGSDARTVLAFDLADPKQGLGARANVTIGAAAVAVKEARMTSGSGYVEMSGSLARDTHSAYALRAAFTRFDPFALTAALQGAAPVARQARLNGTLAATGVLGPTLTAQATFKLSNSTFDGAPLLGNGTVQIAGKRLLPSRAQLSIAGNQIDLRGSFGAAGDRLRFQIDAPQLGRLGFGLAGLIRAQGDLSGSFAHPNVSADYTLHGVVAGANRIGAARGRVQLHDGAQGALMFGIDASQVALGTVTFKTLSAHLSGTRAKHTLEAAAVGAVGNYPLDLAVAARGELAAARTGMRWRGAVTQLTSRAAPALLLQTPVAMTIAADQITLGPTQLTLEGATIEVQSLAFDQGRLRSAGKVSGLQVARFLSIREALTGQRSALRSDLLLDRRWAFTIGEAASGYVQLTRRSGDVALETKRGVASLEFTELSARAAFAAGNVLNVTAQAQANRVGVLDLQIAVPFSARGGLLAVAENTPLAGRIKVDIPALRATGGLWGPGYLLDGQAALQLTVAGTPSRPNVSGMLTGDGLSATLVDQGIQLKNGVVRVNLTKNQVEFQRVEFYGGSGTLRAIGRVRLDREQPDLTARIVADKFELFGAPDRRLSLSGTAVVANDEVQGGIAINGKFTVDQAVFDLPEKAAPHLSDDVVIMRPDGSMRGAKKIHAAAAPTASAATKKPTSSLLPQANIDISLGNDFHFKGHGADLGLRGTITAMSAPGTPLSAVGNVRVTEGSTYTTFGRKLAIENGFFTFNGPVSNPGINILAMRRNQEVEAGVQVTGTVEAPVVKLVSEPNMADNEKLSWLLFGHGTDQGNNVGQQNTMTTALTLLGSATGKRVAQTIGLDEFTIGRSEVGLTDPEVVLVSKAINEYFVLGYEQGLQSASNAFKATINLSRFWSVSGYTGTFQGVDLNYTKRFDRWKW